MTVNRKKEKKVASPQEIESVIAKGGRTVSESELESLDQEVEKKFTLRISDTALNRIDILCKKRIGNVSRNTWILEAVDKLLAFEERPT